MQTFFPIVSVVVLIRMKGLVNCKETHEQNSIPAHTENHSIAAITFTHTQTHTHIGKEMLFILVLNSRIIMNNKKRQKEGNL